MIDIQNLINELSQVSTVIACEYNGTPIYSFIVVLENVTVEKDQIDTICDYYILSEYTNKINSLLENGRYKVSYDNL